MPLRASQHEAAVALRRLETRAVRKIRGKQETGRVFPPLTPSSRKNEAAVVSSSLCHGRRSIGAAARPARARGFSPQNGDETAIDSGYKGLARHKSPAQRRLSG